MNKEKENMLILPIQGFCSKKHRLLKILGKENLLIQELGLL